MDGLSIVVSGGAAGALLWVLIQITNGKLHSSSEVDGLRQDKVDLLKINETQAKALKASNEQLADVGKVLREVLQELREEDPDARAG